MAWPGFRSVPSDAAGLDVLPYPGVDGMYWRESADAAAPALVVADRTPVHVSDEGGTAVTRYRLLSESPYSAGAEVELSWPSIWSVVLVDSLESELCPSRPPIAPVVADAIAFFGTGAKLVYHSNALSDDQSQIVAVLETNGLAPAGAGGEALFTNLYLALSYATSGIVYITPILNGELLTAERTPVVFDNGGSGRKRKDFEVGLARTVNGNRQGLRGTRLAAYLEVVDLGGCGPLVLEGLEVEAEVVTEGVEGRSFGGEALQDRASVEMVRWFMGAGAKVLQGDTGTTDDGVDVAARAQTNALAPAGVGGEAIFTNVYLTVHRDVAEALELRITPILDGRAQEPVSLTLPATSAPVREEHEFGLSVAYPSVADPKLLHAMRGTWLAVRIEAVGTLPAGRVVLEGVEIETEIVTEGTEASNAV